MMRKDVKIGLAIGGVLLAVLIVYVLVGTGSDGIETGAGIVTEDPARTSPGSMADASRPGSAEHASSPAPTRSGDSTDPAAASSLGSAGAGMLSNHSATLTSAGEPAHDPNRELWDTALKQGELMVSTTPPPAMAVHDASTATDGRNTPSARGAGSSDPLGDSSANPATRPSSVTPADAGLASDRQPSAVPTDGTATRTNAARTHIIRQGETLALIAKAAYGDANLYPAIKRANPGLDDRKLRPGMEIVLPPLSEIRPHAGSDSAASTSANSVTAVSTADPKTTYEVQSGDTLERIAMKLYGKREMIDRLYDLNKETIGPDRNKLKLHTLLKLPEPPTVR